MSHKNPNGIISHYICWWNVKSNFHWIVLTFETKSGNAYFMVYCAAVAKVRGKKKWILVDEIRKIFKLNIFLFHLNIWVVRFRQFENSLSSKLCHLSKLFFFMKRINQFIPWFSKCNVVQTKKKNVFGWLYMFENV